MVFRISKFYVLSQHFLGYCCISRNRFYNVHTFRQVVFIDKNFFFCIFSNVNKSSHSVIHAHFIQIVFWLYYEVLVIFIDQNSIFAWIICCKCYQRFVNYFEPIFILSGIGIKSIRCFWNIKWLTQIFMLDVNCLSCIKNSFTIC